MSDIKFNTLLFVGLLLALPFLRYVIKSEHNKSRLGRAQRSIDVSEKASMKYYGENLKSDNQRMIAMVILAIVVVYWLLNKG